MALSCPRYRIAGFLGAMWIGGCFVPPLLSGGAVAYAQEARPDSTPTVHPDPLWQAVGGERIGPPAEIRALWVVRETMRSAESIDRMVDFATQANFNVLFVQVRGRAETYYRSDIDPPAGDLEFSIADFDPLAYLLTVAHRRGLAVHAWVNVLYVWSDPQREPPPRHVVRRHPDWFLSGPSGVRMTERDVRWWQRDGAEGYYLDPSIAAVREYAAAVCKELAQEYPLDGIHLDYVRYPGRTFTLDVAGRTAFALRWGIDPAHLAVQRANLDAAVGAPLVARLDSAVTDLRAAYVDSTVAAIREATRPLVLSAAVDPDPDHARYDKGQDWPTWVYRNDLDFVVPMLYNENPASAAARMRMIANTVGKQRVLPGLALHDGRAAGVADLVGVLRKAGARGIVLFSYNVLSEMPFPARYVHGVFFSGSAGTP